MSSKSGFPVVIAVVFVAAVCGCQNKGETVVSEGGLQPVQGEGGSKKPGEYEALFDKWERLQLDLLLSNAKILEKNYLERKANPPEDEHGKPVVVTPGNSLHYRGGRNRVLNMMLTPALNTFTPHIGGTGDALIGDITVPAARLRVLFDEMNTAGSWTLYRAQLNTKRGPTEKYFDHVGTLSLTEEDWKALKEEVAKSLTNGGAPSKGNVGTATFEVRPLRLFDKSCMTCHTTSKLNDLVGAMLYVAGPEAQD